MSLIGFQTAYAGLVRVPKNTRTQSPAQFLKAFDLTESEKRQLLLLAQHSEVNKYGREQALQRWEQIRSHIGRVFMILSPNQLRPLWWNIFEPMNMRTEVDNVGSWAFSKAFLSFLVQDPQAQLRLRALKVPQSFRDIVQFELAELDLMAPVWEPTRIRTGSKVSHGNWRLVTLNYDIGGWLEAMAARGPWKAGMRYRRILPKKRQNHLVLVRRNTYEVPAMFEVDDAMRRYLLGECELARRVKPSAQQLADLALMSLR